MVPPGPLPGQALVVDTGGSQTELGVGGHHEPGPAISLLGVAHPGDGPVEHLFEEAKGMLLIEAAHIGPPDNV